MSDTPTPPAPAPANRIVQTTVATVETDKVPEVQQPVTFATNFLHYAKIVAIALVAMAAVPEMIASGGVAVPAAILAVCHSVIALGAMLGIGSAGLKATAVQPK